MGYPLGCLPVCCRVSLVASSHSSLVECRCAPLWGVLKRAALGVGHPVLHHGAPLTRCTLTPRSRARCRSTLRHGSVGSDQGPVPLVLRSLSSTAPPSAGTQGAHARPIVAQLTPGDPRPIAAAQNVPAERSGLESREGQPPPSRQPDMLPPPPLEWRSQAPRPSLRVGNWVWRALCDDGQPEPHRLDGARLLYWAARAIARSWRHFESHNWTKLDKLRAATAIAAGWRGRVARRNDQLSPISPPPVPCEQPNPVSPPLSDATCGHGNAMQLGQHSHLELQPSCRRGS